MPKMKPHKSSWKRLKVSATGKIRYRRPGAGHLMSGKSGTRKRHLRRMANITGLLAFDYVRQMGVEAKWRRAHKHALAAAAKEAGNAKN